MYRIVCYNIRVYVFYIIFEEQSYWQTYTYPK